MSALFSTIYSAWNQIVYAVSNIRFPFDIIDILVIAFIIYKALGFLRETRAGQLVKGIVILLLVFVIANWWQLATIKWALSRIFDTAIVAAVVIFQPELRRILERVGRTNFRKGQMLDSEESDLLNCINTVSRAAADMQDKRIGALIVFENKTQLGEIINTGTVIDAAPSVSMVGNIFFPKSPLHDGALIIRDGRLYAAGCILPLTQRDDISLQLGTRHRAAIGMTENSDAIVLVVSEETGNISIVANGKITRDFNGISAGEELKKYLISDDETEKPTGIKAAIKRINIFKNKAKKGNDNENT